MLAPFSHSCARSTQISSYVSRAHTRAKGTSFDLQWRVARVGGEWADLSGRSGCINMKFDDGKKTEYIYDWFKSWNTFQTCSALLVLCCISSICNNTNMWYSDDDDIQTIYKVEIFGYCSTIIYSIVFCEWVLSSHSDVEDSHASNFIECVHKTCNIN